MVQASLSRRLSWPAVLAGLVVAASVQMLLTVMGAGVGAASFSSAGRVTTGGGVGAGLWFSLTGIISFFSGGWVAGRLAGVPSDGIPYPVFAFAARLRFI